MRLGRLLIAMGVVGAAANGCGGGAFQGAGPDDNSAGEASSSGGSKSTGGSKSVGSGGKSTTLPGGAGDDTGTDEGGADSGTGGSTTPLGGKSSGGQPPLGGNAGSPTAGTGGANAGTGGAGMAGNNTGVDGPLKIADLEAIDAAKLTGFYATGFRCKSLTVCGATQGCIYYSGFVGSVQAQDPSYSDGEELENPQAVKIRIAQGAQSDPNMCASSIFTTQPGQFVKLTHDGGHTIQVYFPEYSGPEIVLYVHANGNTYWDAALTQLAGKP